MVTNNSQRKRQYKKIWRATLDTEADDEIRRLAGFRLTVSEAVERLVCIDCERPALLNTRSKAGLLEYKKSGLCTPCYNEIMGIPND
jgi:hypothetical protein